MVAGLMVGVLVLSGSAAVGEENSTDPPVDPTGSVISQEVPTESTETPESSTPSETAPTEAAVPVEPPAEPEAVIGEPLTTEGPAADTTTDEPAADREAVVTDMPVTGGAEDSPGAGDSTRQPTQEAPAPAVIDPNIETDLENYYPGAPVVVTGTGWTPGETVVLSLRELGVVGVITEVGAVADETGAFTRKLDLPDYVMVEANVRAQSASGKVSEKIYAYRGTK